MLSLQSIWKHSLIHFLHFLVYLELNPFQVHGGSLKGLLCLCLVNYDCFREGWRWDTLMLLVLLLLRSWVLFFFNFLFDIPFFPYFPFDNIRPHQPFKQWAVTTMTSCCCVHVCICFGPAVQLWRESEGPVVPPCLDLPLDTVHVFQGVDLICCQLISSCYSRKALPVG